ncbi:MAG: GNAT family N-acetyltransferase [Clostridia bacterium]|nr:GNAT family N-acetyltransferase [Clostridia bacterium]
MPIKYTRILSERDNDIRNLISIFKLPDVSRYYCIDYDNYFSYVTDNPDVYFYKVYDNEKMIGALHLEKAEETLYLSIVVFPEFQNKGNGSKIIEEVKNNVLGLQYSKIEVAIHRENIASLKLFENQGFAVESEDGSLITYIYENK